MKALPTFPCGKEGIEALLPHRDPFLWVSRILECEPGVSVVAELDVDPDLPLFQGHFPGYPVLPGVIIMEALAQAASCCLLARKTRPARSGSSQASTKRNSASRYAPAIRSALRPTSRAIRAACASRRSRPIKAISSARRRSKSTYWQRTRCSDLFARSSCRRRYRREGLDVHAKEIYPHRTKRFC